MPSLDKNLQEELKEISQNRIEPHCGWNWSLVGGLETGIIEIFKNQIQSIIERGRKENLYFSIEKSSSSLLLDEYSHLNRTFLLNQSAIFLMQILRAFNDPLGQWLVRG